MCVTSVIWYRPKTSNTCFAPALQDKITHHNNEAASNLLLNLFDTFSLISLLLCYSKPEIEKRLIKRTSSSFQIIDTKVYAPVKSAHMDLPIQVPLSKIKPTYRMDKTRDVWNFTKAPQPGSNCSLDSRKRDCEASAAVLAVEVMQFSHDCFIDCSNLSSWLLVAIGHTRFFRPYACKSWSMQIVWLTVFACSYVVRLGNWFPHER